MTRIVILLLALAGFSALFAGCGGGGGDENVILAVAFRLDEGTPLMAAYVGDPGEDPFELPAGRYYVEALDEDEVAVSLGAVDVAEGGAVAIPESFEDAGGVADPERAELLITVANFLIDVELAEMTFLEVVTGGFSELPFDPAVEFCPTAFSEVLQMYGDIGEEGDAVLEAISDIEGRAQVSLNASYVCSSWAAAAGAFDEIKQDAREFVDLALGVRDHHRQRILEFAESITEGLHAGVLEHMPGNLKNVGGREFSSFSEWIEAVRQGRLDSRLRDIDLFLDGVALEVGVRVATTDHIEALVGMLAPEGPFRAAVHRHAERLARSTDLRERHSAWVEYANRVVDRLGPTDAAAVRERLRDRVRDDIARVLPGRREIIDDLTEFMVTGVVRGVAELRPLGIAVEPTPTPKATATPPAPQATPDMSWIEGFVEGAGDRMIDAGYSEATALLVMADLEECLREAVLVGQSMEDAVTSCAQIFEGGPTPQATATAAAKATETPQPEPHGVTAVGKFVRLDLGLALEGYDCTLAENRMSLTFNTGGGSATGQGYVRYECRGYQQCPTSIWESSAQFTGAYDPGSRGFTGTLDMTLDSTVYGLHGNDPEAEYCDEFTGSDAGTGIGWRATLQDGTLRGKVLLSESTGDPSHAVEFELTVQE
jgi:hypothetical protein